MVTLFLHEGVPGHHFHAALMQGAAAAGLPQVLHGTRATAAYTEGWALYCETLGKEFGLYDDPAYYYGHLNDELLRAVRLVVDTGMHAQGWSREQGDRLRWRTWATIEARSANQIERYMVWPGQALATRSAR
jgi:uncharacterized protein (DUF885 family)